MREIGDRDRLYDSYMVDNTRCDNTIPLRTKNQETREKTEERKKSTKIFSPYALYFIHVSRDDVAYILLFLSVINRQKFGEERMEAGCETPTPFEITRGSGRGGI